MNILSQLKPAAGATKRTKRRGRGHSSGHGKTSCRGNKGLLSRSGGGLRHGFEGGQMPLIRRIPKRGFTAAGKKEHQVVNLGSLKSIKTAEVITPQELFDHGLVRSAFNEIKILADGELTRPVTIKAHAFSKNAKDKIEKTGGKVEIITKEAVRAVRKPSNA